MCSRLTAFLLILPLLPSCGDSGTSAKSVCSAGRFRSRKPHVRRDIAPLIFKHCAGCHRPGEAAPFPLLSYEDVRKRSKLIAEVTSSRFMPPWLAGRRLWPLCRRAPA